MRIRMRVGLALWLMICLCSAAATAQRIIDHPNGIKASFYDDTTDRLVRLFADRYEVIDPVTGKKDVRMVHGLEGNLSVADSWLINNRLWMVLHPGNSVWIESGDSIRKTRNWTINKMQITSMRIRYGNQILSHGGYGLWSARDVLIRFDSATLMWVPWPLKKGTTGAPGLFQHYGHMQNDRLWMLSGTTTSDRDPFDHPDNHEVWSFHFADSTWTNNGQINPQLFHRRHYEPHRMQTISYNEKFILYPVDGMLAEMDFTANTVKFHRLTTHNRNSDFASQLNTFYRQGKFYYYRSNKSLNDTVNLAVPDFIEIPEPLFLGDVVAEEPIYKPELYWQTRNLWNSDFTPLTGFGLMAAAGLMWYATRLRKRRSGRQIKLIISSSGLRARGKLVTDDALDCAVMRKFKDHQTEIPLAELLADTDAETSDARTVVNRINLQARSAMKINFDIIDYTRLSSDHRMSGFRLSGQVDLKHE